MYYIFYIISILVIVSIIAYGKILKKHKKADILEKKFYDCDGCDFWGISHIFLYLIFGYFFPDKHMFFLILSIGWELFETYLGTHKIMIGGKRFVLIGKTDNDGNLTGENDDNDFWYGRVSDISFNMLGYVLGDYYKRKILV